MQTTMNRLMVVAIAISSMIYTLNGSFYQLNPGCDGHPLCNDPEFANSAVHAYIDNNLTTRIHIIFWQGGSQRIPSITMIKTMANQTLNFNWTCLLNDTCETKQCGYLQNFENQFPIISSVTVFFPFIQFKSGLQFAINNKIHRWRFVINEKVVKLMSLPNLPESNLTDKLQVNISIRLEEEYTMDPILPRLAKSNESFLIDIAMASQDETFVGLQCAIVPILTDKSQPRLIVNKTNTINDEYMPGVFSMYRLYMDTDLQMQWKPIAFTDRNRSITQWTSILSQQRDVDQLNLTAFNASILRLPLCPMCRDNSQQLTNATIMVNLLNFTFEGTSETPQSEQFLTWTMSIGYLLPTHVHDSFSSYTIIFICANFGVPILIMIISELISLIRENRLFGINVLSAYRCLVLRSSAYQEIADDIDTI
ncbi:hypothetical protein GJ496_007439 [Pomphorhynchus laevis]|nr:hypothetical protein GJ496_007439 [Pomphorhynchus laevis]